MIGSFRTRHLPDLFRDRVSAFAGPTIGICRTFLEEPSERHGLEKPNERRRQFADKDTYKSYLVSKVPNCLKNDRLPPARRSGPNEQRLRKKDGSRQTSC